MSRDNLLVKVNISYCHVTQGGGEGVGEMTQNLTMGEGSKKCGKSVTYYFNGPLDSIFLPK
jgi:hypothetical protein